MSLWIVLDEKEAFCGNVVHKLRIVISIETYERSTDSLSVSSSGLIQLKLI